MSYKERLDNDLKYWTIDKVTALKGEREGRREGRREGEREGQGERVFRIRYLDRAHRNQRD